MSIGKYYGSDAGMLQHIHQRANRENTQCDTISRAYGVSFSTLERTSGTNLATCHKNALQYLVNTEV